MSVRVLYIHGIGAKPAPEVLKTEWDFALFDQPIPPAEITTDMVYWADLRKGKALSNREQLLVDHILDGLMRKVTEDFIKDVHEYLYDAAFRVQVQCRMREALLDRPGAKLLIAHSLGTLVAFDVLSTFTDPIHLITIGSPLGLEAIKAHERIEFGVSKLLPPPCVLTWENFADRLDPVALDTTLADDYDRLLIKDHLVMNPRSPREPHSIAGYFQIREVRDAIRRAIHA